jgi:hypothetical protein
LVRASISGEQILEIRLPEKVDKMRQPWWWCGPEIPVFKVKLVKKFGVLQSLMLIVG